MIAYHVDREQSLAKGQIVGFYKNESDNSFMTANMFPDGLSYHGLHYTDESLQNVGGNNASFYILEYELELIRRIYFPNLPSRYQSFFAVENIDELKKWGSILDKNNTVWKIEFKDNNFIKRDSNLLIPALSNSQNNINFSAKESFFYYYSYWNGDTTSNPRFELLIKPPIKIIDKILV